MIKKHPAQIVSDIQAVKEQTEHILANYLENYAEYEWTILQMDDIANGIINIIAAMEHVRCKLQNSIVKEDDNDVECYL